jgi:ATP-dependent Clp protease ATP-binding subunit ClpA
MLTEELETTLRRAFAMAAERRHELVTLEHLLSALTEDEDAARAFDGCGVDLDRLRRDLGDLLDGGLGDLAVKQMAGTDPTIGFQRAVQNAAGRLHPRDGVTGADVLAALFAEPQSRAVFLLREQGMDQRDADRFISPGRIEKPEASDDQGGGGGSR